jgi:hypothetical protein
MMAAAVIEPKLRESLMVKTQRNCAAGRARSADFVMKY